MAKTAANAISVAQALKLKNRLSGQIKKVNDDILTYNSMPEGNAEVSMKTLWEQRQALSEGLTWLKTAIHRANVEGGIQRRIFVLGEKKALITTLQSLNTKHGLEESYRGTSINYVAFKRKADVDRDVRTLEKEIDAIQEEIDQFNHTHRIEVQSELVALVN
jgi:hypothetical protein